jgi:cellulose synthase/poly-beta-1,6-N-acetylglucosamine synthase-like glycosyltransferase
VNAVPRVSVLMSVLNGEAFLRPAIESVLGQTFRDFEFIVIDNASSDGTAAILDGYCDDRIVRLRNESVLSLTKSLNKGLQSVRGDYVARMDADDIAAAVRFARQVEFLDTHPDVVLVASHVRLIDRKSEVFTCIERPTDPAELYDALAYSNPFAHSATMFRRAPVAALGGYPPEYMFAQDLALWLKLAQPGRLGMVDEALVDIREHRAQTTFSSDLALRRHRESIAIFEVAQRLPGLSRKARRLGRINLARIHCLLAGALLTSGNVAQALLELTHGLRLAPMFCFRRALAGRWRTALPGTQIPD